MKKTSVLCAALVAALGMNAETVTYDFNTNPSVFVYLQDGTIVPNGGQNHDFIAKDGMAKGEGAPEYKLSDWLGAYKEDGTTKIFVTNPIGVRISLEDGTVYTLDEATGKYLFEGEEPNYEIPFIGYNDGGPTRTIWMSGWGTEDAWTDANYNAFDEANWVATKHAVAFNRNDHSASRTATYIQFPAFQGPFTVTYYISANSDTKRNKEQALKCRVVPVVDNVEVEEAAQIIDEPYASIVDKRFYKKTYTYTGTDKPSLRIGANGAVLGLYHVVFESGADSGIDNIIAAEADENAPAYNILGQKVGKDYKGLVIKNGVKYIQK